MTAVAPAQVDGDLLARRIRLDPHWYLQTFFGEDSVYEKQTQLIDAIADPRITEIYAPSCHDSGKTWACARATHHFLLGHPHDAIVVTTAPTWPQVEMILWREIASAYAKAKVPIGGTLLKTRLEFGPKWYAVGVATNQPVNIQGYHASNILVIIDEADGVPAEIWTAVDGLVTTYGAKVVAIGNPLDPTSEFRKRHDLAQGHSNKRVIRIAAEDTPNVQAGKIRFPFLLSPGWVTEKLRLWGQDSALAMGKIFARWPDQGPDTFIPMSLLMRARGREVARGPRGLGADIARFGRDRTVLTLFEGGMWLWAKVLRQVGVDVTSGTIIAEALAWTPAAVAIDGVGVGGGPVDIVRSAPQMRGIPVLEFNAQSRATLGNEDRFQNLAAEWWWVFKNALEVGKIGFAVDDVETLDQLFSELNRAKTEYDNRGRLGIDKFGMPRGQSERRLSEEEHAARSPDLADSCVLSYNAALPFANIRDNRLATQEADWFAGRTGTRA